MYQKVITASICFVLLSSISMAKQKQASTASLTVSKVYDVKDFGAKGDGTTLDTKAVQDAIDAAHAAKGGTVLLTDNSTYLIGTIYLKSNVRLHITDHSTLLGSRNLADYTTDTGLCPYYPETLDRCLIYAKGAKNIILSGNGTIDGGFTSGDLIVPESYTDKRDREERPMCIRFENCKNITAQDQLWTGARSWFSHFKNCDGIQLTGLRVLNKVQDGFNMESSQNIRISDCHLECGDDAFAFTTNHKSRPVKNVTIVNCYAKTRWAGTRFGPLGKGDFENVLMSNCIFENCNGGGIKFDPLEGGEVRNCIFSDIVMNDVAAPIVMVTGRWPEIGSTKKKPPMMPVGKIRNIQFNNMIIKTKGGGPRPDRGNVLYLHGYKGTPIKDITLSNIEVTSSGGGTAEEAARRDLKDSCKMDWWKYGYWTSDKVAFGVPPAYGLYVRHVEGLILNNVRFNLANPDERSAIFAYQSSDVTISNMTTKNDPQAAPIITTKECEVVSVEKVRSRDRDHKKVVLVEE